MVLPVVIVLAVLIFYPLFRGIWVSLTNLTEANQAAEICTRSITGIPFSVISTLLASVFAETTLWAYHSETRIGRLDHLVQFRTRPISADQRRYLNLPERADDPPVAVTLIVALPP